jgi:microsomal dipeptidase-like Zn-dependent dipeptidase
MVIACAGFRVSGIGHHQTSFEAIELAMGSQVATHSALFETCRRKRNIVDYDMSGIATRSEVDELIKEATAFVELAERWIEQNHPAFKR